MKFRIVQKPHGYICQKRWLLFFWFDLTDRMGVFTLTFRTVEEAETEIHKYHEDLKSGRLERELRANKSPVKIIDL